MEASVFVIFCARQLSYQQIVFTVVTSVGLILKPFELKRALWGFFWFAKSHSDVRSLPFSAPSRFCALLTYDPEGDAAVDTSWVEGTSHLLQLAFGVHFITKEPLSTHHCRAIQSQLRRCTFRPYIFPWCPRMETERGGGNSLAFWLLYQVLSEESFHFCRSPIYHTSLRYWLPGKIYFHSAWI